MPGRMDEELWSEFAAESEEHLDTVERLLGGAPQAAEIGPLFRAFHSLKGMSAALGAAGMAKVAHRCEDLLGLARQGRLAMDRPVQEGLLAAVDVLRAQRAAVLEGGTEPPPPADLLRRLEGLEGAGPAAPPPPVAAAAPALGPDLAPLAAMLAGEAAGLAQAALRGAGPSAEALALAEEAARRDGARLAETLRGIGQEPPFPLLGRLVRQLEALAALAGQPAGATALVAALAGVDSPLPAVLAPLAAALRATPPDAALVRQGAGDAALLAAAQGHAPLEHWLLLAEDMADRAAVEPDAATRLTAIAPLLAGHLERWVAQGPAGLAEFPPAQEAQPGRSAAVPEELAHLLSAEGHRRIEMGLAAGRSLYRARLGVPSSAEEEAAVQAWLEEQGAETLTSRTLLDTLPPTLDMLFMAPAAPDALDAARTAFDPAGRLVLAMTALRAATPRPEDAALPAASLRVRQEAVDTVIALEAELHAAAQQLNDRLEAEEGEDLPATLAALARRAGGAVGQELAALAARLGQERPGRARARSQLSLALKRLDEAVLELRVVPIGTLFARLPRIVRSVAQSAAKDVALEMEGQEVRIDRTLVELLADPLLHLVRNAVDHGVEAPQARRAAGKPARAVLRVSAERRTGAVRVEVADDGRGIEREGVLRAALSRGLLTEEDAVGLDDAAVHRLLFLPGFSTREGVSETSGRGVGLDVVQEAVRRAGGTLELASRPGEGTRFVLTLPLSAAMASVLLIRVAQHVYAVPAARVQAVREGAEGATPLAALLGLPVGAPGFAVAVRQTTGGLVTLAVDAVLNRTDLLLRPMAPALAALPTVGGVGILGNGEPVVILEPDGMAAVEPEAETPPVETSPVGRFGAERTEA